MFYNICFSQLTDQMNDYMATFQLLGRYLPQISNPDFHNGRDKRRLPILYSAYCTIWTYTSHEESLYNWGSSEDKRTSSEDELASSKENWAPFTEDNSTILCNYRSSSENNWWLILVNCWSRRRKTKVLSGKTWTCSSSYEYWACLWDKQRFWEKSKR